MHSELKVQQNGDFKYLLFFLNTLTHKSYDVSVAFSLNTPR